MRLFRRSIEIILANQAPTGAYIASPNFPTYHYAWFRDGTYIAYAMDAAGEHESARRFHDWAAGIITARASQIRNALERREKGERLSSRDYLHTRYTLDGRETTEIWPNFQLDGFGAWLWGVSQHLALAGLEAPPPKWREAIELLASYLAVLWDYPCYDQWEEGPDHTHVYTLVTTYAGLQASAMLLNRREWADTAERIRSFVLVDGVVDGHLVKDIGTEAVDGALVAASTPYGMFLPDDSLMRATVARIEAGLRKEGGGVHRYKEDTFYGGGEWILLTAWLGWYYVEAGEMKRARELLAWVEAQTNERGELPEQVPRSLNDPDSYQPWVRRWGPIAQPLLWSHAKYLILRSVLK